MAVRETGAQGFVRGSAHMKRNAERMELTMFDQLTDMIVNYVEVKKEDIRPESRFIEDLGFTSFDFMSLLGEAEDVLDVEINQEEAANIRTVQEAVDYLTKLV